MNKGPIAPRRVPVTRGIAPALRKKRLFAARTFQLGTVPRIAVLLGHWDGGEEVITRAAGYEAACALRRRRKYGDEG